ncbi:MULTISPECIES: KEOPS complex subunit Cgi121 [unclassified Methanoregula]|uniref:KEOPS complex subunit Cgi121 n=1 Tax=unclassified Methanoregula TaxID=2649730 RepID=UPI0009D547FF|nr:MULTISPECIES: KEOPS complex subunit Cgi121 [unclassified Methanoregula]OPX64326.1 MAG: Kinase binding protein CGI-121 [Methanoregula sp. PtaB.Bin085]OPY33549.1 MAG: Kinase binding protein CGI-121 [Methanoregula sp. PtaU1.Bin006]
MPHDPLVIDIRAARCVIRDVADFLRDLRKIASDCDTRIICFNADMMAGSVHALSAVGHAVRAFGAGENISNNLEMECLLYAAGSRQCSVAASFGIHEGENHLYICCYPSHPGIWTALEPVFRFSEDIPEVLDPEKRERLMRSFGISSEEIAAAGGDDRIVDLVLERVALLQVTR